MPPKISVVIPVYNAEKYLSFCLDSVLGQDIDDLEVICVDDGSTDSSPEILESYHQKDARIRIIHQTNAYAGVARNNGIKNAAGEYIHFLDADDWVEANAYGMWYSVAKERNADICFCLQTRYNLITGKVRKNRRTSKEHIAEVSLTDSNFMLRSVVPWDKLYRKEFVLKNNLRFSSTSVANDRFFFVASMLKANRIFILNEYLIHHRDRVSSSITVNRRYENFHDHFVVMDEILKITKDVPKNLQDIFLCNEIRNLLEVYRNSRGTAYEAIVTKQIYDLFLSRDLSGVVSLMKQSHLDTCHEILNASNTSPLFLTISAMRIKELSIKERMWEKENQKLAGKVGALEKDARIGGTVALPFRKLVGLGRCYKQHGLRYTLKRVGTKVDSFRSKMLKGRH